MEAWGVRIMRVSNLRGERKPPLAASAAKGRLSKNGRATDLDLSIPHCSVVQLAVGAAFQNSETAAVSSNSLGALDQASSITQNCNFRLGVRHCCLPPF